MVVVAHRKEAGYRHDSLLALPLPGDTEAAATHMPGCSTERAASRAVLGSEFPPPSH